VDVTSDAALVTATGTPAEAVNESIAPNPVPTELAAIAQK
jgi:hypothetical protein